MLLFACSQYSYDSNTSVQTSNVLLENVYSNVASLNVANNLLDFAEDNTNDFVPDAACTVAANKECIHLGEKRKVHLYNESSCSGLTLHTYDSNNQRNDFFDWTCEASTEGGVVFKSVGFASGMGISDVIDWDAGGNSFKEFYVQISAPGRLYLTTASRWWSTLFGSISISDLSFSLGDSKSIYTLNGDFNLSGAGTSEAISFAISNVALILKKGKTYSLNCTISCDYGMSINGRSHIWIEGNFFWNTRSSSAGFNYAMNATNSDFLTLRNFSSTGATYGLSLSGSSYSKFSNISFINNPSTGMALQSIDYLEIDQAVISGGNNYSMNIGYVNDSNFSNITMSSDLASSTLILQAGVNDNVFENVNVTSAGATQLYLYSSPMRNRFTNLNLYTSGASKGLVQIAASATGYRNDVDQNLFIDGNWSSWL